MSSSPGSREVAFRVFAHEFDDASLSYSESEEERAPNYVVTPTGARINRLFVAGVLTEVEVVNEETRRGRVVDPSGAFVTYAGQYQPDEQAYLDQADPPEFVALAGKARTFQPDGSDRVFTSVRPESINQVDADTRDRWTVSAAEMTLDRLAVFERALESELRGDDLRTALAAGGASDALASGIPRALEHYRTSPAYVEAIRQLAVDALELVAGERTEVRTPDITPDEGGDAVIGPLPETDVRIDESAVQETADETVDGETTVDSGADGDAEPAGESEVVTEPASESDGDSISDRDSEPDSQSDPETDHESDTESDPQSDPETDHESDTESDHESPEEPLAADTTDDLEPADEDATQADDPSSAADAGSLGDFDAGDSASPSSAEDDSEPDGDTPDDGSELYELDDEERAEIESEFDTSFSTGTEVEEPGEADIDVPDVDEGRAEVVESDDGDDEPDDVEDEPDDGDVEPDKGDVEPDEEDEKTDDGEETDTDVDTDAEGVDLETVAVEVMQDLDEGDGASREAVVEAVVEQVGATAEDVEDAIQDALMAGSCYEPTDGTLKAI